MDEAPKRDRQDSQRSSTDELKPVLIDIGGEVFVSDSRDPVARWLINDIRLHQLNGPKKIHIHETQSGTIVVFPPDFRLPEHLRFHAQRSWRPSRKLRGDFSTDDLFQPPRSREVGPPP